MESVKVPRMHCASTHVFNQTVGVRRGMENGACLASGLDSLSMEVRVLKGLDRPLTVYGVGQRWLVPIGVAHNQKNSRGLNCQFPKTPLTEDGDPGQGE